MVQEYVGLLPTNASALTLWLCLMAGALGLLLWLLASRYTRFAVTLLTVSLGGVVGMQLPRWFGWAIDGAGPAVAAAVVLGVSGYILHGLWMGLGFGIASTLWVTLFCWITMRSGATWTWPDWSPGITFAGYLTHIWQQLPESMQRILPFGAAASFLTGLAMAIMWPRFTTAVAWSLIGLTMAVMFGIAAASWRRPDLLGRLPETMPTQIATLAALLGIGAAVQWKIMPAKPHPAPADSSKSPAATPVAA